MDKRLILAVAGSGKTSYLISNLSLTKRILLITYTINNTSNLRKEIIKKFGYFPDNIDLYSFYPFLHSFCYKPFLAYTTKTRGISWEIPPQWTSRLKRDDLKYYITSGKRLYHNRISKFLLEFGIIEDIKSRLTKYYDAIYIDEFQDFAGHDFNLLRELIEVNVEIQLVGDFYQHTYDTSRDGNTNASLHDNFDNYVRQFRNTNLVIDKTLLLKSYRCSPSVCEFISNNTGIQINSHRSDLTKVEIIRDKSKADSIFKNNDIIKLFLKEHYKFDCFSRNWGDCKGENHYKDVCVVVNKKSFEYLEGNKLYDLPPVTKNKFYVACSRAWGDLYLVPEEFLLDYKKPRS